jgi:hypothetical protein
MTIFHAQYPHRRNHDGSFDSICPTCFATIGHTKSERELADAEQNHSCEQAFLEGRGAQNARLCKVIPFRAHQSVGSSPQPVSR